MSLTTVIGLLGGVGTLGAVIWALVERVRATKAMGDLRVEEGLCRASDAALIESTAALDREHAAHLEDRRRDGEGVAAATLTLEGYRCALLALSPRLPAGVAADLLARVLPPKAAGDPPAPRVGVPPAPGAGAAPGGVDKP